jgi:hypothetical protein
MTHIARPVGEEDLQAWVDCRLVCSSASTVAMTTGSASTRAVTSTPD